MSSLSFPLCTGTTLAFFHSDGKIPEVIDLLKMSLRDSAIIGAASLINLHDILSKPFAFLVDVDERARERGKEGREGERENGRDLHIR